MSDEAAAKRLTPRKIQNRQAKGLAHDPLMAPPPRPFIPDSETPLTLDELEKARNKAVRLMVGRFREMKPQEIIQAVNVLDSEIAMKRQSSGPENAKGAVTREEMLKEVQGEKKKNQTQP